MRGEYDRFEVYGGTIFVLHPMTAAGQTVILLRETGTDSPREVLRLSRAEARQLANAIWDADARRPGGESPKD